MSGDVLTRWGLVLHLPEEARDAPSVITIEDAFARGWDAYLERCEALTAFLDEATAAVRVVSGRTAASPAGDLLEAGAQIAVSVVEVRPSSFVIAVRIRPAGDPDGGPIDGRWTLVLERTITGERLPVPREVRDELIAIQLGARDLS